MSGLLLYLLVPCILITSFLCTTDHTLQIKIIYVQCMVAIVQFYADFTNMPLATPLHN
jgi:hypothetical protein